jgi:hypothetical protein
MGVELQIHGGTIRAMSNFPRDGYLIELWSSYSQSLRSNQTKASLWETTGAESASLQGVCSIRRHCYKGFAVGRWFQGGGLLIVDSMRITVENVYISHFETNGILGNSSLGTFQRSEVL